MPADNMDEYEDADPIPEPSYVPPQTAASA